MTDTSTQDMLTENEYIDAQEWLLDLDRDPVDSDLIEVPKTLMIDLPKAATFFVTTYAGNISFMQDLRRQFVRKGTLTVPQLRAALKILRQEMIKGRIKIARKDGRGVPIKLVENPTPPDASIRTVDVEAGQDDPDETHRTQCYSCRKWFTDYENVMAHKAVAHYGRGGAKVAVLKDDEVEDTKLDLSVLPDGRYAINDPTGKNDFLYFAVKTIPRRTYRDRKFRYGKFRIGHEWIEAGTIEVRLWSTDSKKWVGAQKPGEGYRGGYVDQLIAIMAAPAAWGLVFASTIGKCTICGKKLTKHKSREVGIGPDCFDKWGYDYWTKYSRSAVIAATAAKDEARKELEEKAAALIAAGDTAAAAALLAEDDDDDDDA